MGRKLEVKFEKPGAMPLLVTIACAPIWPLTTAVLTHLISMVCPVVLSMLNIILWNFVSGPPFPPRDKARQEIHLDQGLWSMLLNANISCANCWQADSSKPFLHCLRALQLHLDGWPAICYHTVDHWHFQVLNPLSCAVGYVHDQVANPFIPWYSMVSIQYCWTWIATQHCVSTWCIQPVQGRGGTCPYSAVCLHCCP